MGNLSKLFHSGEGADVKAACGQDTYNLHKLVVFAQCDFFERALNFKDDPSGTVELHEDEPLAVRAMIHHFYGFPYKFEDPANTAQKDEEEDYEPPDGFDSCHLDRYGKGGDAGEGSKMLFHVEVYALACKYLVDALQEEAARNLIPLLKRNWNSSAFLDVVRTVYEHAHHPTSKPIRTAIAHACGGKWQLHHLHSKPEFKDLVVEDGDFAADLVTRLCVVLEHGRLQSWHFTCPSRSCSNKWSTDKLPDSDLIPCPACKTKRNRREWIGTSP